MDTYALLMNTPPPLNDTKDPFDVELGRHIRGVMEERQVTVYALAKATGLTRQTITRSLEGSRTLTMRQISKIAAALGHELDPQALIPKAA